MWSGAPTRIPKWGGGGNFGERSEQTVFLPVTAKVASILYEKMYNRDA